MIDPRIRATSKYPPPYPLNRFPREFPFRVGKEVVYVLATKPEPVIEGPEWEKIFANAIGAAWEPSNVGLDDIRLGMTAWGAKSVKSANPFGAKLVRLISGRNDPGYSFGARPVDHHELGAQVLSIWNHRIAAVRTKYEHLRTVVLLKSMDLSAFTVFELDTIPYEETSYRWAMNTRGNLEGFEIASDEHRFTWQPHGAQFTIIEPVPLQKLSFRVKAPPKPRQDDVLKAIGFDYSWIEIVST